MDPTTLMLIMAAAQGAQGAGQSIAAAGKSKRDYQLAQQQLADQRAARQQNTALAETGLDPFRHQMNQATALSSLDQLERASYSPVKLGPPPSRYAGSVPSLSGGMSYDRAPEVRAAAGALKRNVMAGQTAPTMTDPNNYGRTGALNLLALAGDGVDPATVSGAATRPTDVAGYYSGVDRRMAGRIGASETRATDVSVQHAAQILDRAIRAELGRAPMPGEIEQMLAGQGLKAGDRWVGEQGLMALLQTLRSQAAPQPSYAAAS